MEVLLLMSLVLAILVLWKVLSHALISPLSSLPGPPNPSWILGHFVVMFGLNHTVIQESWTAEYGPNITYKGLLGVNRLYTTDLRALGHVLSHSNEYPKPQLTRYGVSKLLGPGLLVAEGEQHRQQRRVLNPAFSLPQIREFYDIFQEKSIELRDYWMSLTQENSGPTCINVLSGISRMALDTIGLSAFNYRFNTLTNQEESNELYTTFNNIVQAHNKWRILPTLQNFFPFLNWIPSQRSQRINRAMQIMRDIGASMIADNKPRILSEMQSVPRTARSQGRDMLSLLVKANLSNDIPDNQRLSDDDVIAQVPTFIVLGHETTASALTWCLYALTQAPDAQQKLREELLSVPTDDPSIDELTALPYLDAVVRETLRLHTPLVSTMRVASKDDVIPVSKPYADRHGRVQNDIRIGKGDVVIIPILAINRSKELWGNDSFEFKPERWEKTPEKVSRIPGVWGNLFSFLGGPRACIGYRFSLVEMKTVIFTLVRAFEFKLAVPPEKVTKSTIVQRPIILDGINDENQMPLLVTPYHRI